MHKTNVLLMVIGFVEETEKGWGMVRSRRKDPDGQVAVEHEREAQLSAGSQQGAGTSHTMTLA